MTQAVLQKKIATLEAEVKLLKKAITARIDFDVDEANWRKIKPTVKKIRQKLYNELYG